MDNSFSIYPEPEVKRALILEAKKNNRSLNGQICFILKNYVQSKKNKKKEKD